MVARYRAQNRKRNEKENKKGRKASTKTDLDESKITDRDTLNYFRGPSASNVTPLNCNLEVIFFCGFLASARNGI